MGHHTKPSLYGADALQITTCKHVGSGALLSSDESLVEASRKLGLAAFDIVKEEQEMRRFLNPDE